MLVIVAVAKMSCRNIRIFNDAHASCTSFEICRSGSVENAVVEREYSSRSVSKDTGWFMLFTVALTAQIALEQVKDKPPGPMHGARYTGRQYWRSIDFHPLIRVSERVT